MLEPVDNGYDDRDGEDNASSAIIRFSVGVNQCIDKSGCITEVLTPSAITPVPGCAPWFKGISTYRGDAIPVSDLGVWCGDRASLESDGVRLLILAACDEYFGLLVDSVQALHTGDSTDSLVSSARSFNSRNARLGQIVSGAITEQDGVVLVVDLQRLATLDTFLDISSAVHG